MHGSVDEHKKAIKMCRAIAFEVRTRKDLANVDALIIPGGESTTIGKLLAREGLDKEIIKRARKGMPIYGTCAGAIILAKTVSGNKQPTLGLIDISIERNAYGRQVDSFETELKIEAIEAFGKKPLKAVFIRAPIIKAVGKGVVVLAKHKGNPVLAQHKNILAGTFHPELTSDLRLHKYFLRINQ